MGETAGECNDEVARGVGAGIARRGNGMPWRAPGMLAVIVGLLAGCTAAPVPPTTWLRLSTEPLPAATSPARATAGTAVASAEVWQFVLPVSLPGQLDREAVFVPQGAAGAWVQPLAGARWIEPLRDTVPRVLREDLMRQLGGTVLWWAPLPPGVVATRQLRVEIVAFEIAGDGRSLVTEARWTLADARGARPPAVHTARLSTPPASPGGAEGWAIAHRQALAELATRIAATMTAVR